MTAATASTLGEIKLAGDLMGTPEAPHLRPTGVYPGSYLYPKMYVDATGRVLYAKSSTVDEIRSYLVATTSSKGVVQPADGFSIAAGLLSTQLATSSLPGTIRIGSGIDVAAGIGSIALASSTTQGRFTGNSDYFEIVNSTLRGSATSKTKTAFARIGTGFTLTGDTISAALATSSSSGLVIAGTGINFTGNIISVSTSVATTSSLGLVKIGSTLDVLSNGTVSIPIASASRDGVVRISYGQGFSITGNILNGDLATTTTPGQVQIGSNIAINTSGVISVPDASTTIRGIVRVGSNINVSNGVISVPTSTSTSVGVVQIGNNISVSNGDISIPIASSTAAGVFRASEVYTSGQRFGGRIEIANGVIYTVKPPTGTFGDNVATDIYQYGYVKIGQGFNITTDGVLSTKIASATELGTISIDGTSITLNALDTRGLIDANIASTSRVGMARAPATNTTTGIIQTGTLLSAVTSTASVPGIARLGTGLISTGDTVSLNLTGLDATTTSKGFVQVGDGFSVTAGTIAARIPTSLLLGTVQITNTNTSTGLYVSNEVLNVRPANFLDTTTRAGIVQVGQGFTLSNGAIGCDIATTTSPGLFRGDNTTIDVVDGILQLPTATITRLGGVRVGTGFTVDATGVLSKPDATVATSTSVGLVQPASTNFTVAGDGTLSLSATDYARTDISQDYSTSLSYTPNIITGATGTITIDLNISNIIVVEMIGNVTLDFTNYGTGGLYQLILRNTSATTSYTWSIPAAWNSNTNKSASLAAGARRNPNFFVFNSSKVFFFEAP